MKIDANKTRGYIIHKVTDDNYCVCRILNEYKSLEKAKNALIGILSGNITEKELLDNFIKEKL